MSLSFVTSRTEKYFRNYAINTNNYKKSNAQYRSFILLWHQFILAKAAYPHIYFFFGRMYRLTLIFPLCRTIIYIYKLSLLQG